MIKCCSLMLLKECGWLGRDQVPYQKHGSDFFLLSPGLLVDQTSGTSEKGSKSLEITSGCEFLPLHLEIISQSPMFVLMQVLNQNIQKIENSTTSDPKSIKRNMNHVDIRVMELQQQKQSLMTLFTCTAFMHTSCWSASPVHLFTYVLLCLRLSVLLCTTSADLYKIGGMQIFEIVQLKRTKQVHFCTGMSANFVQVR